ncbi:hypothetical protein CROQUDRAFT_652778 [Cronartium quercuum f. sp. fusiforme G11]|uniref:EKC/KEOPS complex subunit CGI121 n=1 Tax=Cronartium quercuum f. sp. fusiforme G11 TaxID=708437 RepID=A0A9P6NMX1_9BASI|nr:hypothetical protein CROQUDRAFT_652778 [Cronartium quercuum f. sp. fusiforme G11]
MERFEIPYLNTSVYLWFFTQLGNAAELRSSLIEASKLDDSDPQTASQRARLDWAFLNSSMITSLQHLQTAIYQALLARSHGQLKTKTIHSEIMWTLSPGTNISDAIKRFGMDPKATSVVLVKICDLVGSDQQSEQASNLNDAALELVDGKLVPIDQIRTLATSWKEIRKVYKLNEDLALKQADVRLKQGVASEEELQGLIDHLVISTVALKTVAG